MSSKKIKKNLQLKVAERLTATFGDFQKDMSQKKFKRNIKKASKALLAGLKTAPEKRSTSKKVKSEKIVPEVKNGAEMAG
jgi:hypothetical protein